MDSNEMRDEERLGGSREVFVHFDFVANRRRTLIWCWQQEGWFRSVKKDAAGDRELAPRDNLLGATLAVQESGGLGTNGWLPSLLRLQALHTLRRRADRLACFNLWCHTHRNSR